MTSLTWVLLAAALAWGVFWFMKRRGRHETERQAKADKSAKTARDEARAIQRTLDGRR